LGIIFKEHQKGKKGGKMIFEITPMFKGREGRDYLIDALVKKL